MAVEGVIFTAELQLMSPLQPRMASPHPAGRRAMLPGWGGSHRLSPGAAEATPDVLRAGERVWDRRGGRGSLSIHISACLSFDNPLSLSHNQIRIQKGLIGKRNRTLVLPKQSLNI